MNKKGFEFSFAWLFSILVGAVIIIIAVFVTINIIDISRTETNTKLAAQLGTLLNPIETNLEDTKYAVIEFPDETRVYNTCRETGNFGRQVIGTSLRSGLGEREFKEPEIEVTFFNKYLFSDEIEQGKNLYVLVKPFEFPYKVADLVFAYSESYCFVNPPSDIEDEINDVNAENIQIVTNEDDCLGKSERVCFGKTGCDIDVNLGSQRVSKNGQEVYYEGPLLYGAIFSDPEIYECQVKRLLKRSAELAHVYASKSEFLASRGCSGSSLAGELRNFASLTNIESSGEMLNNVSPASTEIRRKNEALICRVF